MWKNLQKEGKKGSLSLLKKKGIRPSSRLQRNPLSGTEPLRQDHQELYGKLMLEVWEVEARTYAEILLASPQLFQWRGYGLLAVFRVRRSSGDPARCMKTYRTSLFFQLTLFSLERGCGLMTTLVPKMNAHCISPFFSLPSPALHRDGHLF